MENNVNVAKNLWALAGPGLLAGQAGTSGNHTNGQAKPGQPAREKTGYPADELARFFQYATNENLLVLTFFVADMKAL